MTKKRTELTMGEQLASLQEQLEKQLEPMFEGKSAEEQEALAQELAEEFFDTIDGMSQALGGVPLRRPKWLDRKKMN